MTQFAVRPIMPQPDFAVRRRQARRFWGGMGAAMRETSRWLDGRGHHADAADRRADALFGANGARSVRGF